MRVTPLLLLPLVACDPIEPPIPAPESNIEVLCLDPDCASMAFDGTASLNADTYSWIVDGVDFSNDNDIQLDLLPGGLVQVQLKVENAVGTSLSQVFVHTPTMALEAFPEGTVVGTVIAGVDSCDAYAVISTLGGCFTGQDLRHAVTRFTQPSGNTTYSVLDYLQSTNRVMNGGIAAGAVWQNFQSRVDTDQHEVGLVNQNNYPSATFPRRARVGESHLTSYYGMSNGMRLDIEMAHLNYTADGENLYAVEALRLDCTSGTLQVSALQ